jgi:hypothetical protein
MDICRAASQPSASANLRAVVMIREAVSRNPFAATGTVAPGHSEERRCPRYCAASGRLVILRDHEAPTRRAGVNRTGME